MNALKQLTRLGYCLADERVYEKFQAEFPGKYHIEWYYSPASHKFEPKLIFDSPADETWFYLQYSQFY